MGSDGVTRGSLVSEFVSLVGQTVKTRLVMTGRPLSFVGPLGTRSRCRIGLVGTSDSVEEALLDSLGELCSRAYLITR